jgi:hypothetical protein
MGLLVGREGLAGFACKDTLSPRAAGVVQKDLVGILSDSLCTEYSIRIVTQYVHSVQSELLQLLQLEVRSTYSILCSRESGHVRSTPYLPSCYGMIWKPTE